MSESGSTPARRVGIVLIHGLTGTPVEMKPLEKHLRRLGFDVENVLLAGHGGHHREILSATWHQWLDNVRDALKNILARNDRAILCGLSMGAILASVVASENDKVCGAILMSPTWAYDGSVMLNKAFDAFVKVPVVQNTVRKLVGWFPVLGEKIYWEETPPYGLRDERLQRQITKSIEEARKGGSNEFGTFRTYYGPLWQMWALVDYARPLLRKVRCPVMIVSSLEDTLASINNATSTYMEIAAENKALVFLTGCDHVMTLDLQKQQLFKLIEAFLAEYKQEGARQPVISTISPALYREKPDTKGGAVTVTLSPNTCGLTPGEWADLYTDLSYSPVLRSADTIENHSLVARNNGSVVLHVPLSLSSCFLQLNQFRVSGTSDASRADTIFSMGSSDNSCPIGMHSPSDYVLYVKVWKFSLEIFLALGRTRKATWYAYNGISRKAFSQLESKQSSENKLETFEVRSTLPHYRHRNSALLSWFVRTGAGSLVSGQPVTRTLPDEMLSAT